jgi:catechol 2,3-dioxygenase-like lactoylglutathione lyase family enzyme
MKRPPATLGLHHVALVVPDLAACEHFYVERLGMRVEWRPDADNLYLTHGNDNLALHRGAAPSAPESGQRLDHIGFCLASATQVDAWYAFLQAADVPMRAPPRSHRDGARSFYCYDPAGTLVQFIYHPPLAVMPMPRPEETG